MKIKNMKRTVVTTALALTLTAGLTIPTQAAPRRLNTEEFKTCLQVSTNCKAPWLQTLLDCLGGQKPETPDTPTLPDTPTEPDAPVTPQPDDSITDTSVHAYEKAVAELVNAERAKYGLAPLTLSSELSSGARAKSKDMSDNNYFSHTSPTYGSAFDMMKQFGITYKTAGENIAHGYSTPEAVVTAWMNSEGHRANILDAGYTTLGVGYVADGNYWTQWFIS